MIYIHCEDKYTVVIEDIKEIFVTQSDECDNEQLRMVLDELKVELKKKEEELEELKRKMLKKELKCPMVFQ